jgi:hypothetical protein
MPFGIWKLSSAAVLIVVGLSGCGNGSEMAFWEACTKNVKRGMTLSEVERICGKAQYLGKTGPFQGYKYTHPKTKQDWLLFFENDILKEAQVPSGNR